MLHSNLTVELLSWLLDGLGRSLWKLTQFHIWLWYVDMLINIGLIFVFHINLALIMNRKLSISEESNYQTKYLNNSISSRLAQFSRNGTFIFSPVSARISYLYMEYGLITPLWYTLRLSGNFTCFQYPSNLLIFMYILM